MLHRSGKGPGYIAVAISSPHLQIAREVRYGNPWLGNTRKGIPSTRDSFLCDATRAMLGCWLLVGEDDSIAIEQRITSYPSSSLTDRQDSSLWSGLGFTTPAGSLIEKKSVCRRT